MGLWLVAAARQSLRVGSLGAVLVAVALGSAGRPDSARSGSWPRDAVFYILAAVTVVVGRGDDHVSQSRLLGHLVRALAAGHGRVLFLYDGAQFLGVATIVVYAGAILVTFLFVLMLAQPEGQAAYDRVSWAPRCRPSPAR